MVFHLQSVAGAQRLFLAGDAHTGQRPLHRCGESASAGAHRSRPRRDQEARVCPVPLWQQVRLPSLRSGQQLRSSCAQPDHLVPGCCREPSPRPTATAGTSSATSPASWGTAQRCTWARSSTARASGGRYSSRERARRPTLVPQTDGRSFAPPFASSSAARCVVGPDRHRLRLVFPLRLIITITIIIVLLLLFSRRPCISWAYRPLERVL